MADAYLLHHEEYGNNNAETIILIPGLFGSTHFWYPIMHKLEKQYRVISLDPLGFGRSPKPRIASYTVAEHIASIARTLEHLKVEKPSVIIGHSMGSLLALYLTQYYPQFAKQLILVSMPVINSKQEAFAHITTQSLLPSYLLHGENSQLICELFCHTFRRFTARFLPLYLPEYPKPVIQDSLLHRYYSYSRTLDNVIMDQHIDQALARINVPINMLYGEKDNRLQLEHIEKLRSWKDGIKIDLYERAGHMLPLEFPEEVLKHINNPDM